MLGNAVGDLHRLGDAVGYPSDGLVNAVGYPSDGLGNSQGDHPEGLSDALDSPPWQLGDAQDWLGYLPEWLDNPPGWLGGPLGLCSACVAVDVSLCSEVWFQDGFSDLIQVWEVVVSVVLIFNEDFLQLLIEAFEGTEIGC